MNQLMPSIVIDAGTLHCRAGIANEIGPEYCFPSNFNEYNKQFVNRESSLIQDGVITQWDQYENLLHYIYQDKLRLNSNEYPCLITEVPNNPKSNKEKLAQMMFEKIGVQYFHLLQQSVLTLISYGKQTGISFDSGEGLSYAVPIFEGYQIPFAIKTIALAGRSTSNWLAKILIEQGVRIDDMSIVQNIKEKSSYVALDYFSELKNQEQEISLAYLLPDGTTINISSQRFRCPEILFQPNLLGFDIQGIHQLVYQSIMSCDQEIRSILFQNIALSGGNTMFLGFEQRLEKEISKMSNLQVSINAQPNRYNAVWIGGSIMATQMSSNQQWITKQEYDDIGPQIIHRKQL